MLLMKWKLQGYALPDCGCADSISNMNDFVSPGISSTAVSADLSLISFGAVTLSLPVSFWLRQLWTPTVSAAPFVVSKVVKSCGRISTGRLPSTFACLIRSAAAAGPLVQVMYVGKIVIGSFTDFSPSYCGLPARS